MDNTDPERQSAPEEKAKSSQQYSNVEIQRGASNVAARAISCQLPSISVQPIPEAAHRQTQSIDLGTTELHISWKSPRASKGEQDNSKYDKRKVSNMWMAAQIFMLLILIPAAFLAGFSIATIKNGPASGRHSNPGMHHLPLASNMGRQSLHDPPGQVGASSVSMSVMDNGNSLRQPRNLPVEGYDKPPTQILFVTWIAFGEFGDGGFHTHNFHKVDMRWAEIARLSHPGCKIGLIMDQDTLLADTQNVDFLHRITIDKKAYGRNEYNDYYHWTARYSFLEKLMADGEDKYNVVFLDPDVFVMGDIEEVFDHSGFDYATTISENRFQPVNGAMHFVRAHRYGAAVDVLKDVLAMFQLTPDMGFTAGQQAYADFFELTMEDARIVQMQADAVEKGIGCNAVKEGDFTVCYFICTRYNFWEDCSDHPDMQVRSDVAEDYARVGVKVFHFVAYRKLGMQRVYDAFMEGGLDSAQKAFAALPHDEDGFDNDPSFAEEA